MTISDLPAAPSARASRFQLTAEAAGRYERIVGTFMMPLTGHLIDRAGLCEGDRVRDAAAAVAEAVRVLRPGGRFVLSVWSGFDRNPFRAGQVRAMSPYLPPEAVTAFARTDVSALGGVGGVESLLRAAGLNAVHVAEHELQVSLPPMADFYPTLMAATPWAAYFAQLAPAERREVIACMDDVVVPAPDGPGGYVPMVIVVATATTP